MQRAALLLVVLAAGCSLGGDGNGSIERSELGRLVLQPRDLPEAFVQFDKRHQTERARFDRIDGWTVRYHRSGTPGTTGPIVVASKADLFESADGAKDAFEAALADVRDSAPEWKPIGEPGLGEESFAATSVQTGAASVRYYEVFWREGNATATLDVNGFEGKLPLADVLALARKQERRIAEAHES